MSIADFRKSFAIFNRLTHIARLPVWAAPAVITLGLVAALLEALSLALVIPLFRALNDSAGAKGDQALLRLLNQVIDLMPVSPRIFAIVAALVGAAALKSLLSYANLTLLGMIYGRASHGLRTSLFSRMMAMPLSEVKGERATHMLHVINNESWRATDALYEQFTIVTSLTAIAVLVPLLLILSWQLSLLAVLCVVLIPLLGRVLARKITQLGKIGLEANQELTQRSQKAMAALRVIRGFGREELELDRLRASSDRVRRVYLRRALVSMISSPLAEILIALLFTVLAFAIEASQVSLPVIAGFLLIAVWLRQRVSVLRDAQKRMLPLNDHVVEVNELLSKAVAKPDSGKQAFKHLRAGVRFEDVSFSYPETTRLAIKNVSFQVGRSGMIAIAGAPGSGRSTLLDLLLDFQRPQRGTIRIDGTALDTLDTTSWRAEIGIVTQDAHILDDTVKANILYGKPDASLEEIEAAARFAGAEDFIRALPKGFDTPIGQHGSTTSSSQRQLIGLARALVRDPEVLIVDEAANNLDKSAERAFLNALTRFAQNRLVFLVANQMSFVERADVAIVLEEGSVVQEGPPHMLLGLEGAFAKIYRSPYRATAIITAPRTEVTPH